MSVLVIDGLKCTLIASHADPWWVTVSMPTGQTDRRKPDRVTLRFPLSAANVITWRSSSYLSRIKSNLIIRKLVLYNLQAGYERGNFVPSVVWLLTVRYVRAHWQLYTCSQNCLKSEHFHSATVLQNVHSADSRLLKTHLVHKSCLFPQDCLHGPRLGPNPPCSTLFAFSSILLFFSVVVPCDRSSLLLVCFFWRTSNASYCIVCPTLNLRSWLYPRFSVLFSAKSPIYTSLISELMHFASERH